MSSAGTFSPSVRFSFASRFRRVSVAVGVTGVVGVTGSMPPERDADCAKVRVEEVSGVYSYYLPPVDVMLPDGLLAVPAPWRRVPRAPHIPYSRRYLI